MRWRSWLKFYRYVWRLENYLLLVRTWQAARLVKRLLNSPSPSLPSANLKEAIAAVPACYPAPQPHWQISDPAKIYLFAHWVTGLLGDGASDAGRCVKRSLIVYRLLNGYGIPARVQFGIDRNNQTQPGHAWVCLLCAPHEAFGETENPTKRFLPVFTSALPEDVTQ